MAVYKRRYESYRGPLTAPRSRFLVLARYAIRDLFRSRFFFVSFAVCLLPVLVGAGYLFVAHTDLIRTLFRVRASLTFPVGARFFSAFLETEASFAFLLMCWVCPTLVSGDLTNGALPLFLSRPISRAEYVAGKFAVLAILISFLTWIPAIGLFFLQSGLSAESWLGPNLWMLGPILWCSFAWITLLSLLALAISAWIRWRVIAMGAIFALFLIPAGLGAVIDAILHMDWGGLLSMWNLFHVIIYAGFGTPLRGVGSAIPPSAAWAMLTVVCLGSLQLLNSRLRAFEVVRG